jgi:bacterioferritin-associated ferredoxin
MGRAVVRPINRHRPSNPEEVGKALRAGTNCGSCPLELRKIIQAQVPQTT